MGLLKRCIAATTAKSQVPPKTLAEPNKPPREGMYRASSPIFDVPEFPTLRRIKPLPKRRRTSPDDANDGSSPPSSLPLHRQDASVEELMAQADALSAHIALQSYYMPILGGVQDFLRNNASLYKQDFADFGLATERGKDEEEGRDCDYVDHLQQPGNNKKRKVPTNIAGLSRAAQDPGPGNAAEEDEEPTERNVGGDIEKLDHEGEPATSVAVGPSIALKPKKGKMSPATLAGLQRKEMLKNRKRQLAAVLGALSLGDTLALDQALTATYAAGTGLGFYHKDGTTPKTRLSRREGPSLARAAKNFRRALPTPNDVPFPQCEFTFRFPSATSDRLIATKAEVAALRSRFEAELARQAEKANKLAPTSKRMAALPLKSAWNKRASRAQQRPRTTGLPGGIGGDQTTESSEPPLSDVKNRGKKKKRSALANASNPHHLRNYVPSRFPHSGQANMLQNQNYLYPPPLQFLSAEIPPRRRKNTSIISQYTHPNEEWICPRCEYQLFFGDENDYRRAIRNRKKILRRRRRARERAAMAASGSNVGKFGEKAASNTGDQEATFDPAISELGSESHTQAKWKGDPQKQADRGHSSFGQPSH